MMGSSPIRLFPTACVLLVVLGVAPPVSGAERYALIVSGASGGARYAEAHERWRSEMAAALREQFEFPDDHVIVLADEASEDVGRADRDGVRAALSLLRDRMSAGDFLLVVLIGHGTFDGVDAKFNLVGPDFEAAEWNEMLSAISGRTAIVNTTSSSFPFLQRLAAPGRIVITATDSPAQRYETIFPQFFAEALQDPATDLDRNGRVSLWEVFFVTSTRVRQWYEQQGRLSTERALLDDDGSGVGKDAATPGTGGALAAQTFLNPPSDAPVSTDPELTELIRRQHELQLQIEELKTRRDLLPLEEYQRELEQLLLELARVSQEIRQKS